MRKYILLIAVLIICQLHSYSQWSDDSLKIVNLKERLIKLSDTARVICLNEIASAYYASARPMQFKADSAYPYVKKANEEAVKLNHKYGLAQSLINLSLYHKTLNIIARRAGNKQVGIKEQEKYLNEAIQIGEEIQDFKILGTAYGDLAGLIQRRGPQNEVTQNVVFRLYEKAISMFEKAGYKEGIEEMTTWICMDCTEKGDFEKGIGYCLESLKLNLQETSRIKSKAYRDYLVQQSLINMADLYKAAGDYDQALVYLRQSRKFGIENNSSWIMQAELGELFTRIGQFDSAFYLLKKFTADNPRNFYGKMWLGETYLAVQDYDNALKLFRESIDSFRTRNTAQAGLMRALIAAGKAYTETKNYKIAFHYATEGIELARQGNAKPFMMEAYKLLSRIYYQLGKNNKAYQYLLKHTELKDSILNRQFLWKLNQYKMSAANEKKESQLTLLDRDNKIKEQQLRQEAQQKKLLTFGLLGLLLTGFFTFRTLLLKRKNEKLRMQKNLEVQQLESGKKQSELEMQALRAQMNPHFIFNSLSSINRFILKNEPDTASDYLTRFSRLIRMVLINSQKSLITLEDELDMLTIYLDMERLRFKNNFDYHIVFTNRVDAGAVYIPPLLLQPFCENAIWHGLKHLSDPQSGRHEQGRLDIELSMSTKTPLEENKVLICSITDNGIGRQKAAAIKSKSAEENKSMGLKITTERLALLNQEKEVNTSYEIVDMKDENGNVAGTNVILKISLSEPVELSI